MEPTQPLLKEIAIFSKNVNVPKIKNMLIMEKEKNEMCTFCYSFMLVRNISVQA